MFAHSLNGGGDMIQLRMLIVAVAGAVALSACASVPATHVVVPAHETLPQMQKLSQQSGSIASVVTVSGEEMMLSVVPGGPDTLAGKRFDSAAHGQDVVIPFDLLALVYYTDPSSDKLPEQLKLPVKDRYPEPKGTGAAEEALSCEALDVELALSLIHI